MEKWQPCCKNQNVVFRHQEPMSEGKKCMVYLCTNCRAQHSETFDADGVCLKRNMKNADPFNL